MSTYSLLTSEFGRFAPRGCPVAARRVRRPGAWSRVFRGERPTAPAVPRYRAARHVVGVRMRVPLPGAPRSRRQRSNVDRPARPSGRDARGTRYGGVSVHARRTGHRHRPPRAAARRHRRVGGTARGASSFTASRSSRFARFDIVSFRSRRRAAAQPGSERGPRHAAGPARAGRHARRIRGAKRKGRSVRVSGLKNAYKSR